MHLVHQLSSDSQKFIGIIQSYYSIISSISIRSSNSSSSSVSSSISSSSVSQNSFSIIVVVM